MADLQARPPIINALGGDTVTLTGSFVLGRAYSVFAVSQGSQIACYSGVSGQGAVCIPQDTATLTCVCPTVSLGRVTFDVVDDATQARLSTAPLVSEAAFLHSRVFALRTGIRDILDVGETDPNQLPDAEQVPADG